MDWLNSDQDNFSVHSDESYYSDEANEHPGPHKKLSIIEKKPQVVVQKIVIEENMQLTEENISCKICCRPALNAVICKNQKCRKLICTVCATSTKASLLDKCPFCRSEPFDFQPSRFAKQINKMEQKCTLCKEKYALQFQDKHYKTVCSYFQNIKCRFCNGRFKKNEIAAHTKLSHPKQVQKLIYNMYINPPPQHDAKVLLEKNKQYLQKINKKPQLGTSGKFYCGGKLETKCNCCNGYCGPTNGQNCVECMKLDIKKFGLPKGFLVNSVGRVCYLKGNDFICGVKLNYEDGHCQQGKTCRFCTNMKKNIKRYQDLI